MNPLASIRTEYQRYRRQVELALEQVADADLHRTLDPDGNSIAVLLRTAAAQGAVVSPICSATVEGDSNDVFPFGQATPRRYMQIHADLGTTPLVITKLAFRINRPTTPTNFTGTRVSEAHSGRLAERGPRPA